MQKTGFTGTSKLNAITPQQYGTLRSVLQKLDPIEFHHGDCLEADAIAHGLAEQVTNALIIIHPPVNPRARAFCMKHTLLLNRVSELKPKDYLDRNHDIVDATDMLIACPLEPYEVVRSGTWATVRYARKLNRPIIYIMPNGEKLQENWK